MKRILWAVLFLSSLLACGSKKEESSLTPAQREAKIKSIGEQMALDAKRLMKEFVWPRAQREWESRGVLSENVKTQLKWVISIGLNAAAAAGNKELQLYFEDFVECRRVLGEKKFVREDGKIFKQLVYYIP